MEGNKEKMWMSFISNFEKKINEYLKIFEFPTITEELYPIVSCIFKDACLEKE